MKVMFIRHGQTKGNKEKRYVGSTDEGLTIEGREAVLRHLYPKVDAVFVSPKRRCMETALLLFPEKQPISISNFRECNFGTFEYKNYEELSENKDYLNWIKSGGVIGFPEGETRLEFQKRCIIAFDSVIEEAIQKDYESIALVVHGGTIMSILDKYSMPKKDFYDWQVENGQGFLAELNKAQWKNHIHRLENIKKL